MTPEELKAIFKNNYDEADRAGYSSASKIAAGNAAVYAASRGESDRVQRIVAIEAAVFTEEMLKSGEIDVVSSMPIDISKYRPGWEDPTPVVSSNGVVNAAETIKQTSFDLKPMLVLLEKISKDMEAIALNFASRDGFAAYQTTLNDSKSVQIAAYGPNRRSLVIRNIGAGAIYIGPDQTISVGSGQVVLPYDVVEITNDAGAVWGISLSGDQVVSVMQE